MSANGLTHKLMSNVSHSCLNEMLREVGLGLPARSRIIASIACVEKDSGGDDVDRNGDNVQFLSAAAATSNEQLYWVKGVAAGLILCAAPLSAIIYSTHEQPGGGVGDDFSAPSDMWSASRVLLPGALVFLVLLVISPWLR